MTKTRATGIESEPEATTQKVSRRSRDGAFVSRKVAQQPPERVVTAQLGGELARQAQLLQGSVMEEATRSGLLAGERTEHVSFRAPPALVEAAKKAIGVSSTTELGILALAMLAQPDPTVAFLRAARGQLGKDHDLDI